jgi:hypothetical protein
MAAVFPAQFGDGGRDPLSTLSGVSDRPRLLVLSRDLVTLRGHYEDVIVALREAGVAVSIRYSRDSDLSAADYESTLRARGCDADVAVLPRPGLDDAARLALHLRQLSNLLRYSHPDYRGRDWLRDGRFEKATPGVLRWTNRIHALGSRAALGAVAVAQRADRVLPASEQAAALIEAERPDAVAAVGVIRAPEFVEHLKAARAAGISTAVWIQSWDNLSSKGLVHFVPDRVFVWNETQRGELERYHGIPADHVSMTGAQTFEHWFTGEQPANRKDFCRGYGLDPERPIVLYLVSSRGAEPSPETLFRRWLAALRASDDPQLAGASVLVRPHPTAVEPWLEAALDDPRVAVSPSTAADPINSPPYRQRFREELHHASAAFAINTSALIDAAIMGTPALTAELPEFAPVQRGTVHFEYLVTVGGGLLRSAPTLEQHVAELASLIGRDPYERDERGERFIAEFVRPQGDVASSRVFADEMRKLLEQPSSVRPPRRAGRAAGALLHRWAGVLGAPLEPEGFARLRYRRRKTWKRRWQRFLGHLAAVKRRSARAWARGRS